MEKIKPILFISDNFPPVIGGSSTVYHQICTHNSQDIVALSSQNTYKGEKKVGIEQYDANCGYLMYRTPYLRAPLLQASSSKLASVLTEFILILKLMIKIINISLKHQVKVICIGELVYGGWIVLFSRYILRKKTILYTHGEEISQASNGLYNNYRGTFLKAAHKIVSVSLFCKSQIVSLYHISPNKIDIISNGVDTLRFQPAKKDQTLLEKISINPTDKIILSVGRLVKRKGHYNLIKAFQLITQKQHAIKLIIIGAGPEGHTLKKLTETLNLQEYIYFLTDVNDQDLIRYYQSADIFTMPNITLDDGDTEGFGLVFLEANACQKPVVGGQAGGAIEAIQHNKTGLLVDGYNVEDIAEKLLTLINTPDLANQLAEQGLTFAKNSTWDVKAKKFNQLSNQLVQNTPDTIANFTTAKIAMPINTQKRLHITVDFEEMFDWSDISRANKSSVKGIKALEKFHQRCNDQQITPCYLVTHEVLNSDSAVDFLKSIYTGQQEIGIHLHPWNSPPFIEKINTFNSFQCNLPSYLEQLKLSQLMIFFEEKLGFKPLIHRAGRYGVSQQTLTHLENQGIMLDLSPSAGFNFKTQGGPDFTNLDNQPFWSNNHKKLLCLPVPSIIFFKGPDLLTHCLHKNSFVLPKKISQHFPNTPVRFSPESNSLDRMKLMGSLLNKQGLNDFVLAIHSTSLYQGGNEYAQTQQAAQANMDRLINYVAWSKENIKTEHSYPLNRLIDNYSTHINNSIT